MIVTGDWLAPSYNEQPFFDKPVLFHQLQAFAMVVLGPTEFAARIVPALAAFGLVLTTCWFGSRVASRDTGILAALLLLASPGTFALARYAILDTLFTLFLFGGVALLAIAVLHDRPRLQWPGYLSVSVAVMVKGPLALVLCALTLLIAIAVSADLRRRLLALHWFVGLLLIIAAASPSFIYLYARFRDAFLEGYVFDENLRLYASSRFANQPGFWFYFRILAAALLPWTGLLIGRFVDDVRAVIRGERLDALEILLWAWTAAIVGFFTFSAFKLDHYVFPAAPALCLLSARAWFDVREHGRTRRHAGARLGLYLVGPLVVTVGLGCGYFLVARLELSRFAAIVPIALTVTGTILTVLVSVRGAHPPRAPWLVFVALFATYLGIVAFVMPALERRKVVVDLARHVASDPSIQRVATYRLDRWNPAFRFYAERHVTFLEDPSEARAFFDADSEPFYCVMRRAAFDEFVALGVPLRIVREEDGMWATSGRALWRTQMPTTRFVLATIDR